VTCRRVSDTPAVPGQRAIEVGVSACRGSLATDRFGTDEARGGAVISHLGSSPDGHAIHSVQRGCRARLEPSSEGGDLDGLTLTPSSSVSGPAPFLPSD
jgi:hypothetical protein